MKRSFVFSAKFLREIESLPKKLRLEAYEMITSYGLKGEKPETFSDEALGVAWSRIVAAFKEEKAKETKIPDNMFESKEEEEFDRFMREAYPSLFKFDNPLTYNQYQILKHDFSKDELDNVILSLSNTRGAEKKYISVYSTLRMWLNRNKERRSYGQKAASANGGL